MDSGLFLTVFSLVTAVVAGISTFYMTRLSWSTTRSDFHAVEVELEDWVKAAGRVNEEEHGKPTAIKVTDGSPSDAKAREALRRLERRLDRVEAVSERIEVRRQALLETYHNQGLSQSKVSFWFSLLLGTLGFGVIVFALVTKSQDTGAYVSGAVTEAVAALFFTQSNLARRLMAEFFDKLRDDRRLEESLKLTDNIADARLKASLQALMALQLVSSTVSPSVLPGFQPEADGNVAAQRRDSGA